MRKKVRHLLFHSAKPVFHRKSKRGSKKRKMLRARNSTSANAKTKIDGSAESRNSSHTIHEKAVADSKDSVSNEPVPVYSNKRRRIGDHTEKLTAIKNPAVLLSDDNSLAFGEDKAEWYVNSSRKLPADRKVMIKK
jgi:hypothetical protein